jgi:hypothetical protein
MRIGRPEVSARCFDVRVVCWGVHIWSGLLGCLGFSLSYRIGLRETTVGGGSLSVLSVRSCVGGLGSAVLRKRFACRIDLGCGVASGCASGCASFRVLEWRGDTGS